MHLAQRGSDRQRGGATLQPYVGDWVGGAPAAATSAGPLLEWVGIPDAAGGAPARWRPVDLGSPGRTPPAKAGDPCGSLHSTAAQFGSAFGFAGPLGGLIGQIRTDASGGYSGPVVRFGGGSFTFGGVVATGEGPPFAIQFIINTPGVRSELVAGITINR